MKVISRTNMPTNLPVSFTLAVYLLLDRLNVKEWIWATATTLLVFVWISILVRLMREQDVDLLGNDTP